jgi:hypothetical protein
MIMAGLAAKSKFHIHQLESITTCIRSGRAALDEFGSVVHTFPSVSLAHSMRVVMRSVSKSVWTTLGNIIPPPTDDVRCSRNRSFVVVVGKVFRRRGERFFFVVVVEKHLQHVVAVAVAVFRTILIVGG